MLLKGVHWGDDTAAGMVWLPKGCSQSAVSRHLNGKSVGRKQCGRKRCTTRRGDRTLRKIVEKDRFQTLGNLRKQWTESGVETSRATVHRRVQEMGYRCRIPQQILHVIRKSRCQSLEEDWGEKEMPKCLKSSVKYRQCRAVWNHRGLSNPLEKSSFLGPSIHRRLHWRLPISIAYPTLRSLHRAGPMRHIQMDPPPKKKENGGENSRSTSVDVTSTGQTGVLNASQDCRVLVDYPVHEHKLQKVYHVSITSDSPGSKAICRQALKRGPAEQLPEPPRSPRRAFWGHTKSECPPGNYQSDGDYMSCPLADDDDTFEDGLLTEEIPTCSSAQHFSHSGLRVVEHRAEGFFLPKSLKEGE
ncbi:unnamed protein product [Ranitomeya imitator]|uniref:Transposase Tc1-like domain-containing protein n=1 Tax=Ranitomeya imitator TaxID=111125 RepID=A0ABN9L6I8_9NEOB|nr:unnamed protein product [Ranitomeya imitator]